MGEESTSGNHRPQGPAISNGSTKPKFGMRPNRPPLVRASDLTNPGFYVATGTDGKPVLRAKNPLAVRCGL
jgi:hypothetical protein